MYLAGSEYNSVVDLCEQGN